MFSLADSIKSTLEHSITSVSSTFSDKKDTRSRKLSVEKTIHLLIGADGGSLAKELHRVGIDATPAAVSQRRANIPPNRDRAGVILPPRILSLYLNSHLKRPIRLTPTRKYQLVPKTF